MLHSYAFSNFRSFRNRVEVSLNLTDKDAVNGWDRVSPFSKQRLTTAMAVMGANGSGKTSLILPLAFLGWFIKHSFSAPPDSRIPVVPHFNGENVATEFEIIADDESQPDAILRYRLSVSTERVLNESLDVKVRRGSWRSIFDRRWTKKGRYLVTQDDFGLDQERAESVRQNVSLISWGAQFGVTKAQELSNFTLLTNMNAGGKYVQPYDEAVRRNVKFYAENASIQQAMRKLLAQWDLGLSDVTFRQSDVVDANGSAKKEWFAFGVHREGKEKTHLLPFSEESSGTKAAFTLLAGVLAVLQGGGLVVYDELDGDLHPHMLEPLLDLFSSEKTNPRHAQIVFTCHMPEVLRLLQKSQVMLVEKEDLESAAWRLDSIKGVRSDDNRVAKYLSGAYGAIPRL